MPLIQMMRAVVTLKVSTMPFLIAQEIHMPEELFQDLFQSHITPIVCRLCKEVEGLKAELRDRGCRVGVSPASPQVAGLPPASSVQQELHRLLQDQQGKIHRELEALRDNIRCHAAATQQTFQSPEKEMYGAQPESTQVGAQGCQPQDMVEAGCLALG